MFGQKKPPATYGQILSNTLQTIQLGSMAVNFVRSLGGQPQPEFEEPPLEVTGIMEGLADLNELEQYRYQQGAFYLGRVHPDHGDDFEVGIKDDKMISLTASTRSGKGRSVFVQNALRWGSKGAGGGLVCFDPKGEIASVTAMRRGTSEKAQGTGTNVRQFIGQEVAILDPFNQVIGPARRYRVDYNPLADINIKARDANSRINSIAAAVIIPEEGNNSHFSTNAETLVAGAIETVLYTQPKQNHNLIFVRQLLTKKFEDLILYFQDIKPKEELREQYRVVDGQKKLFREVQKSRRRIPKDGLAAEAVSMLEEILDSDEAGSFKTTLSKNLKWTTDPDIRDHLKTSNISIQNIVKSRGSLYIVVPPHRIEEFASWVRLILQQAIEAKIALGTEQYGQQTLFLVDEFPLLGRFKIIERGSAYLAGYNIKFAWAIQQISQLKTLYNKNWEAFFGGSGAIIIFATNDDETEQYLSTRMNKIMAIENTYSINHGVNLQGQHGAVGHGSGKTVNQSRQLRAVRLPNEIHEQGARETGRAFIIPAGGKTFTIARQNYDDISQSTVFDSPQFNVEWQKRQRGKSLR